MNSQKTRITTSWHTVFPNDANPHGTLFGGALMAIMDIQAGIAASHYCHKMVVTASTEAVDFKVPIKVGERVETISRVVFVGRTSMVVRVDAYSEHPLSGKRKRCTTAYFNMVALDEDGMPTDVPPLVVETEDERREYALAAAIKQAAMERKQRQKDSEA